MAITELTCDEGFRGIINEVYRYPRTDGQSYDFLYYYLEESPRGRAGWKEISNDSGLYIAFIEMHKQQASNTSVANHQSLVLFTGDGTLIRELPSDYRGSVDAFGDVYTPPSGSRLSYELGGDREVEGEYES